MAHILRHTGEIMPSAQQITIDRSILSDQDVRLSQRKSHVWESANFLRDPVGATCVKTNIFLLLFFKQICDVRN